MATDLAQQFCALRDTYIEKQFGRLNDMQREAVFTTNGPLLILAGAGSGKTTVLVNRIANLIRFGSAHGSRWTPREVTEDDVKALRTAIMTGTDAPSWLDGMLRKDAVRSWNVMAITFTNKAAGELKERLRRMLGGEEGDEVFASTFHSACVRILRRWAEEIGYPRSFTIYDSDDSQRVMKTVYKELSVDDKFFPVKSAINQMSRWKDQLISPTEALKTRPGTRRALLRPRSMPPMKRSSRRPVLSTSTTSSTRRSSCCRSTRTCGSSTRTSTNICWWTSIRTPVWLSSGS